MIHVLDLVSIFLYGKVSGATEISMNDEEQINRIGRPILTCAEGAVRAAAIRRWGLKYTFLIPIAYIFFVLFQVMPIFQVCHFN